MMKKIAIGCLTVFLLTVMLSCGSAGHKDYPIQPVSFTKVQIHDDFWAPRLEANRMVTIPLAFEECENTGRIENFAIAAGLKQGEQIGRYPFNDSDVFKIIEGASYSLMEYPDPSLDAYLDSLIYLIGAAQEEDGYLYTARTNNAERLKGWFGDERWSNLKRSHELYNLGHMYEAAVAHYQATGKRSLLDIALKSADLVDATFGPEKLQIPPGHQVIEMGLAKLYRATGEKKYLRLAKFFLDVRGDTLNSRVLEGEYTQDHKPVVEQDEAVGHAVRAGYLYAGMADVAALTGDRSYIKALNGLWNNVVGKKLYLIGGLGSRGSNEGFSENYDLPNMSAYNETCASIANVFWNHRMFLLHGNTKYIDVMERTMYNGLISGIAMDGSCFFYPNALESVGQHERSTWFSCACCPSNVTRFMASLPGYVYGKTRNAIYVNLFIQGDAMIDLAGGSVGVRQETRYPWEERVRITLDPQQDGQSFTLNVRIPGWAQNQAVPSDLYRFVDDFEGHSQIRINGETVRVNQKKGYVQLRRKWKQGDVIELDFPMPVRRIAAHDSVLADRGKVALQRGPLVYCAEWPDHKDGHVRNVLLSDDAPLSSRYVEDLLDGVMVIEGEGVGYTYLTDGKSVDTRSKDIRAIPYYAWAHRGKGEMAVWFAREEAAVTPANLPTLASTSQVTASFGRNPEAVNDQLEPESSIDHEVPYFHWWPNKGSTEWIQYTFPEMCEVSIIDVYWFDDTGMGECRVPESWRILFKEDGEWKRAYSPDSYGVAKDQFNRVVLETVRTREIRLEIKSQPDFAGGIHEWKIE